MPFIAVISVVGVALIAFGVILKALTRGKEQYARSAQEIGMSETKVDEAYRAYAHNRAFVANVAIWWGAGLLVMAVFRLV